jgi:hypothetical protein
MNIERRIVIVNRLRADYGLPPLTKARQQLSAAGEEFDASLSYRVEHRLELYRGALLKFCQVLDIDYEEFMRQLEEG